jgi:hypothetical protein
LRVGDKQITLPRAESKEMFLSAAITDSLYCAVSLHGDLPGGRLLCIEITTSKLLWDVPVWSDFAPYVRSGGGFHHWSEPVVVDRHVILFGMCNDVAYIEGFRLSDGKAQFRFSTTYGWDESVE